MKRVFAILFIVAVAFIGFHYLRTPADEIPQVTVVAPDYLVGHLDKAADQFFEENRIKANIIYEDADSVIVRARFDGGVDMFISGNRSWFDRIYRDTLMDNRRFSCPFWISLVLIGRPGGPQTDDVGQLKDERFKRVVIVDPSAGYDGRLAQYVLKRKRIWQRLQTRLILAKSAEHLLTYLTTGEADAAILLESSMDERNGAVIMKHLNKEFNMPLLHCGAVTAFSKNKKSAGAFLDLLDSHQCVLYKTQGIHNSNDDRL